MSSKKGTPNSTPTLFNYFKKLEPPKLSNTSPSSHSTPQTQESTPVKPKATTTPNSKAATPKPDSTTLESNLETPKLSKKSFSKRSPNENDADKLNCTESKRPRKAKRVRASIQSDSEPEDCLGDNGSEDEYIPPKAGKADSEVESSSESEEEASPPVTSPSGSESDVTPVKSGNKRGIRSGKSTQPAKKTKLCATPSTPSTPRVMTLSTPSQPAGDATVSSSTGSSLSHDWLHYHYDFLQPDHIMDAERRRPNHPEYNPRTLYVPPDFIKKLTPCMTQWWTIKSQNFDCVLFFKVGKFYELFHMDAVIGADELACSYMKNEHAHSGFPEISYGKFAQTLVEKGYKVARVEQTETPEQLEVRAKRDKLPGKQRVVRREICKITCRGAQTFSIMDVDANYTENKFLLSVTRDGDKIGVCFVDTTIGEFHVGEFKDDQQFSRLSTLMSHYPPCRILLEKSLWSSSDLKLFLNVVRSTDLEFLSGKKEIPSEDKLLSSLAPQEHEAAKPLLSGELRTDGASGSRLDLKCFGAMYWFLKRCLISEQLVTLGKFKQYVPVDQEIQVQKEKQSQYQYPKYMILDSTALSNLHVLLNSDNNRSGTLLEQLDHCVSSFGKRMLRAQLLKPLTSVEVIRSRQEALDVLLNNRGEVEAMRSKMKDLKDLERMLPRIYSLTSSAVPANHPESRATLYEHKLYSKKKIEMFTSSLRDLKVGKLMMEKLQKSGITHESKLLAQLCNYDTDSKPGCFPDMTELLNYFESAFDHKEASNAGHIIPQAGVDKEYDQVMAEIKDIEKATAEHLRQQSAHFGASVVYNEAQKKQKKYVLEVPSAKWSRAKDSYTKITTKKKNVQSYTTPETKVFQENLEKAEAKRVTILGNMADRILTKFCNNYEIWNTSVHCLATMDFLSSLAEYCSKESNLCTPTFVAPEEAEPHISAVESYYPCATAGQTFIPNSIVIGRAKEDNGQAQKDGKRPTILLLTGPNMGGKSTAMRQIGLITILAQMGCRVPADAFTLSPVDRIFTRMGAKDNLSGGQSTYHAELTESEIIMKHASAYSLALVDELGRGTSTNDGCVIARVTLEKFLEIGCMTVFATHYHSVANALRDNPRVAFEYMSYLEDKRNSGVDTIVFLYKLVPGICPKSFGFNVAELAKIKEHTIQYGTWAAFQMEVREKLRQLFLHKFVAVIEAKDNASVEDIEHCLAELSIFESEINEDVKAMNVDPDKKVLDEDWWPTRTNDPCSYEMAVKPVEEMCDKESQGA